MIAVLLMQPPQTERLPFFVHRCVRTAEAVLTSAGAGNECVVVGVSGGGDSMALLEIAGLLAPKLGLSLHVVCVDHGLRPEAQAESRLVHAASQRWGATFHALSVRPDGSDEDSLRRARHAALESVRIGTGSRFILFGHTRDDQVETIVLRFLRGAGFGGLAGMREARGPLLRPLLSIPRAQLRRLLVSRAARWAEDATNESDRYARGRLRTRVLPVIEETFGGGALDHLVDVAPRWRADEDFLELEAARLLAYASRRGGRDAAVDLDIEALACAHPALRARVLRRWLLEATGRTPASREIAGIERWLESAEGRRGRLDLAGIRLTGKGGRLSLDRPAEAAAARAATEEGGVDTTASSDDSRATAAKTVSHVRVADRAQEVGAMGKAVLPPSGGRVRFPRKS